MALKAILKTLDGLDAAQKGLYRQEGDKFMLDVEPVDGFELTGGGLKSALLRERDRADVAEKTIEKFKGIDIDKARDALTKVEAMKNWTPEEKVREQIEAKTRELAAQKEAEYAPKLKSAEATRRAYESLVIDKALEDAASKHKFIAPHIAPKLFKDGVKLEEKDGAFTPVVLGNDGKPRTVVEGNGTIRNLTIDEYVAEKAHDKAYAALVQGNGATGTQGRIVTPEQNGNTQPQLPLVDTKAAALERLARLNDRA